MFYKNLHHLWIVVHQKKWKYSRSISKLYISTFPFLQPNPFFLSHLNFNIADITKCCPMAQGGWQNRNPCTSLQYKKVHQTHRVQQNNKKSFSAIHTNKSNVVVNGLKWSGRVNCVSVGVLQREAVVDGKNWIDWIYYYNYIHTQRSKHPHTEINTRLFHCSKVSACLTLLTQQPHSHYWGILLKTELFHHFL